MHTIESSTPQSVTAVPLVLGVILIGLVIVGFVWWRGRETAVVA